MKKYQFISVLCLCALLNACATTAPLSLPPEYIKKHANSEQSTAPSSTLLPYYLE